MARKIFRNVQDLDGPAITTLQIVKNFPGTKHHFPGLEYTIPFLVSTDSTDHRIVCSQF